MAGNMALRIAVVMAVLFGIMQLGDWRHVLAAVFGFTLTRWLATSRVVGAAFPNTEPRTDK
jgi:hypothetical protein